MSRNKTLTTTETSEILGLTPQGIAWRARQGHMPYTRTEDGNYRFSIETVANELANRKAKSVPEITT